MYVHLMPSACLASPPPHLCLPQVLDDGRRIRSARLRIMLVELVNVDPLPLAQGEALSRCMK